MVGPGDLGQTLGPQKPKIGTVEVADLLNCRADMRVRQASLPPPLSPTTGSPTSKVTAGLSQCFLRLYYAPGPWLRCMHLGSSRSFLPSPGLCPLTPWTLIDGQAFPDSLVFSS